MSMITIKIPNEVLLKLNETQHKFTQYIKLTIAIDLYKNKNISVGYCAEIADMSIEDFIAFLGINHISIFSSETEKELKEEIENA